MVRGGTVASIRPVIYCVVPQPLAHELYDRLNDYYSDDPHVTVIVDRRKKERRDPHAKTEGLRELPHGRRPRGRGPRAPARRRRFPADRRGVVAPPTVRVVVHVDGGSRGNPGPAAAA